MTTQTSRVLGKVGDIGKRLIAFTKLFVVLRRNFVTRTANELLRDDVSRVRELCVIDFWRSGATPATTRTKLPITAIERSATSAMECGGRAKRRHRFGLLRPEPSSC